MWTEVLYTYMGWRCDMDFLPTARRGPNGNNQADGIRNASSVVGCCLPRASLYSEVGSLCSLRAPPIFACPY